MPRSDLSDLAPLALSLAVSLGAAACASSRYVPRDAPWLATTIESGMHVYKVRGATYRTLADATQDDAEAHDKIAQAESEFFWGIILTSLASGVTSLGMTEVLLAGTGTSFFDVQSPAIGFAIFGVGVATLVGGAVMATGAERDRIDAINMFNDHMFERWLREREQAPPPSDGPGTAALDH